MASDINWAARRAAAINSARSSLVTAPAKAATGPGVWSMSAYAPVTSLSAHPSKLMQEAEALFHTNGWVAQAERAIIGRYVKAEWHLERSDGETVDPAEATGPELAAYNLIAKPSANKTRRGLWSLTLRHMGLPGNAFWYLDQREFTTGIPLELLYINPVRMTPVQDPAANLLGWVMDGPDNPVTGKPGQPGVPFTLDELRHFILDEPDFGHYGIGIAEAAASKVILDKLADRHAAQVLDSGGRIAGLLAPKTGATMSDDDWQALLRDYRNIVGDPDSAKRLHVVKGPVDFTETAANPTEMMLTDLMRLSRESVFGLWGVPLSQIGIMQASGLNSGEHVKFEEAALWQGAIEFRAQPFEETVQSILDLFGLGLRLVVDKPEFDDEQPLYENAEKAKVVPMTVNQRLEQVGLDPLDPEKYGDFGEAIFIDKTMVRIDPLAPEPEVEEPTPLFPIAEAKAGVESLHTLGERLRKATEPSLRKAVAALLGEQRDAIANLAEERHSLIAQHPRDVTLWWYPARWEQAWAKRVEPIIDRLTQRTVSEVDAALQRASAKADDDFMDRIRAYLRVRLLERARDIDTTTRQQVSKIISSGVTSGLSPAEIGQQIREAATFSESRSEMIARTETAFAQNAAQLRTYGDFGVHEVQAIDGDDDAECAARNGSVLPLNEAENIVDHPNGTLDWVPILGAAVGAKARVEDAVKPEDWDRIERMVAEAKGYGGAPVNINLPSEWKFPTPEVIVNVPPAQVDVHLPEQAAPAVTVNVPEQAAPQVTVNMPEQAPAKAEGPTEVVVTSLPDRVHKPIRNKKGQITTSVETDA